MPLPLAYTVLDLPAVVVKSPGRAVLLPLDKPLDNAALVQTFTLAHQMLEFACCALLTPHLRIAVLVRIHRTGLARQLGSLVLVLT
jgi:hypothetical protein